MLRVSLASLPSLYFALQSAVARREDAATSNKGTPKQCVKRILSNGICLSINFKVRALATSVRLPWTFVTRRSSFEVALFM